MFVKWRDLSEIFIADASLCARLSALEASSASDPHKGWSAQQLLDEVQVGVVLGLSQDDTLVGYAAFRAQAHEWWVMNVFVAAAFRSRGHAGRLLKAGIERGVAEGFEEMWLEVRESNAPARACYAGLGFAEVARRKNYYPLASRAQNSKGREDALYLRRTLGEKSAG